ncbi:glycosyltransferase family 2 protein [Labrys sp. (in: a-proteobacteria)]|uniref:glycosyltransferase family 2 protein n=1 Tax=Labrys sp. (in: a-proteobacteria) TaxID=1917972 RepID=UPI0039E42FCA
MTAKVIVGVPVYNGAEQLRDCLECLISQTFRDIEIRIYDNASQDSTPEIAQEFAARDSRVKYIRHPTNIRAMPNFLSVLRDCEAEFVMWRAHDDLCAPDYIERLYVSLVAEPSANVAVPTTRTQTLSKTVRISRPKPFVGQSNLISIIQLMFNSHAGWFYGLWRRDRLLADFEECWRAFAHPWALDHLILFPSLLEKAVVVVPEALFVQRLVVKGYSPQKGASPPLALMTGLRKKFSAQCRLYIERSQYSKVEKLILQSILPIYVDRRVYKIRKVIKRKLLMDLGGASYNTDF